MKYGKILIIVAVAIVAVVIVGYYQYNKPHRTPTASAFVAISSIELFNAFESDEVSANENFMDKIIEVNGEIVSNGFNQEGGQVIVLKSNNPLFGVSCTMSQVQSRLKVGDSVRLKGFCKGYLSDVVLTDCIPVNR